MKPGTIPAVAACALSLAACQELPTTVQSEFAPQFSAASRATAAEIQDIMGSANDALDGAGADYRVVMAEYITAASSDEAGAVVLAKNVGNKRLAFDFVPNDPRRVDWSGPLGGATDDITYAIDRTGDAVPPGGGLSAAVTDAAIERAMQTWDELMCSDISLTRNPDFGLDIGIVAFQFSGGAVGSPFVFADVQHAGWRDLNFAGGVLGVTFTFQFIDDAGAPTDINGDGRIDAAFREIYYDPSWIWADDGTSDVDVESVAVHEVGHGLSQAHFGTVFLKRGEVTASPRAVMNALYSAPFRSLQGSDVGGHCGDWGEWPDS